MENHFLRIIYFVLFVPVSHFCIKWIWTAACRSSLKREDDVRQYEIENRNFKGQSNVNDWVINTSPTPHKTLLIVILHSILFIPGPVATGIAVMAYFVEPLISVSEVLAAVLPCIYFSLLITGLFYMKFSKEPDYSEVDKDFPMSLKSLQLEEMADEWETGKRKRKFHYVPSNLPKLIVLVIWTAAFLWAGLLFLTQGREVVLWKTTVNETTEAQTANETVEARAVKQQIEEMGMQIFDDTVYYRNNWESLTEAFTTHKDDISMVFYFFEDASGAEDCYGYYINKYHFTAKEGPIVDENGFVSYSETYGTSYWCVARFGNSVIEAHGTVDDIPIFEQFVKDIGYWKE